MKLLTTLLLMALAACTVEDPLPQEPVSPIPHIELISLQPDSVRQLTDTLWFTIAYTDGDGDLGDYHGDTLSLRITDLRFPLVIGYHIPPLAPAGTSLAITGELRVALSGIILYQPQAASEQATFSIRLKDRAGQWSNEVFTPAVTVLP